MLLPRLVSAGSRRRLLAQALALLLLGLLVRLHRLTGQSLWYDEGVSVGQALGSLTHITGNAALDIHPPLYYYLLHFWVRLLGPSEFALRLLGVLLGVLAVAALVGLGRRLGSGTALLAGLMAALSPFWVSYSQEVRMYALLGLESGLVLWGLWGLVRPAGGRSTAPYVALAGLATLAALYTHYFAFALVLTTNGLAVLLLLAGRLARARFLGWLAGQTLAGLAFLPWFLRVYQQIRTYPAATGFLGPLEFSERVLATYGLGTTYRPESAWLALPLGALAALGLWSRRRDAGWLLGGWALGPPLFMLLFSLDRPVMTPRFLIVGAGGFLLLVALGVRRLAVRISGARHARRLASGAAVAVALVLPLPSLTNYLYDPAFARHDYRRAVELIQRTATERDVLLLYPAGMTVEARVQPTQANPSCSWAPSLS